MADPSSNPAELGQILARQQLDLARVKDALALLGVNECANCSKFVRRTDPGAMFDAGELVCYGCIRQWWPTRNAQMAGKQRDDLEGKLVFWLRDHHHAEIFKDQAKLPDPASQEIHMVANCLECHGTGQSMGDDRCRYCDGRGTVWVVVPRKK
ncbi:MAG TPA: hypothetical protein VND65_02520 [Candidatus Binatia bacterium]|nr:hypothetical protein [Candidatus Binatia bacterium]